MGHRHNLPEDESFIQQHFWNDEMAKWNTSRIPLLKHKENNNISTCNFISGEMVKKVAPIYLQNLRLDH